jgi:hypothetical protein
MTRGVSINGEFTVKEMHISSTNFQRTENEKNAYTAG